MTQALSIIGTLSNEISDPVAAARTLSHVQWTVRGERERGMTALGYQLRAVENRLFATSALWFFGAVEEAILALPISDIDKIKTLVVYFTAHNSIGIGDRVEPHTVIDIEQLNFAADALVNSSFEFFSIVRNDTTVELYHRCIADGYTYRLAEELVQAFPARAPM